MVRLADGNALPLPAALAVAAARQATWTHAASLEEDDAGLVEEATAGRAGSVARQRQGSNQVRSEHLDLT
jgi:hypothetical protein